MLTEIVNIFRDIALRHKGVRTFRYQDKLLFNQQNNFETYQIYVDTAQFHELNITTNIFKVELQLYVLGHPTQEKGILETQDEAYTIATDILAYIDTKDDYKGIISLYDYSIITLDHFTDDDSAGVRLSIVLATPSPVNLCSLDDNFNEEPYEPEEEPDITVPTREEGDITIKTIKLPKTNRC